jgi:hypothetical protein
MPVPRHRRVELYELLLVRAGDDAIAKTYTRSLTETIEILISLAREKA